MAENRIRIAGSPRDVFVVLADADAYAEWVVGAKKIRASDPGWPSVGSRFHHSVGVGPAAIDDSTEVIRCEPDHLLELETRFRPAGVALVTLILEPDGAATRVTMREEAVRGPARAVWGAALNALTHARNAWSLRRLRRMVLGRSRAVTGGR